MGRFSLYLLLFRKDINIFINKENNNNNRDISVIAYYKEIEYNKKIKDKKEGLYSRDSRLLNRRSNNVYLIKNKLSKSIIIL